MESNLIRLQDNKTVWISADGLSEEIEELCFKVSSSHGHYLSISMGDRKAAVFPFEIFTIGGESFYFGPEPCSHQIVRPSSVKWIRPSGEYTSPIPGVPGVHGVGALIWLMLNCALRTLRTAGQVRKDAGDPVAHVLMKGCAALAALTLVVFMIKPNTLHAPTPSHGQIAQSTYSIGQIQATQAMRAKLLAEAQSKKETATNPASEAAGISSAKNAIGDYVTQESRSKRTGSSKTCIVSDRLSVFMSPSQLRNHFKRCRANEE
jgi:hypothetical protein